MQSAELYKENVNLSVVTLSTVRLVLNVILAVEKIGVKLKQTKSLLDIIKRCRNEQRTQRNRKNNRRKNKTMECEKMLEQILLWSIFVMCAITTSIFVYIGLACYRAYQQVKSLVATMLAEALKKSDIAKETANTVEKKKGKK